VANKVTIGTFFPKDLNLNGDQANLLILKKRLEARGVSCEIEALNMSFNPKKYSMIFIGHGSMAAWDSITETYPEIFSDLKDAMKQGVFVFAVASGYDRINNSIGLNEQLKEVSNSHRSEFIETDGYVGYLNSSSKLDPLVHNKSGLFTLLHGPLLAKNPDLADAIISQLRWADVSAKNAELEFLDELAKQSRRTAFEH